MVNTALSFDQTEIFHLSRHVSQLLLDTFVSVQSRPVTDAEPTSLGDLPPPLLPNNWESSSGKCFIGPAFVKAVVSSRPESAWEYKDERMTNGSVIVKPKLGFISYQPGSVLRLKVNTTAPGPPSSVLSRGFVGKRPVSAKREDSLWLKPLISLSPLLQVTIEVAFLKSWDGMGQAAVMCESGCTCPETRINGHGMDKVSLVSYFSGWMVYFQRGSSMCAQVHLHEFEASQNDECIVAITVLQETNSSKHKVKISGAFVTKPIFSLCQHTTNNASGIIVSESTGDKGLMNHGAVDMAHDGANWGRGGAFEMRAWYTGGIEHNFAKRGEGRRP